MTPQLSPAQLQHAIDNGEKLVAAKKLEIQAYANYAIYAPNAVAYLLNDDGVRQEGDPETLADILRQATRNLFEAKLARAEVELEELEMQVKAYKFIQKQSESRIQVPGVKMG